MIDKKRETWVFDPLIILSFQKSYRWVQSNYLSLWILRRRSWVEAQTVNEEKELDTIEQAKGEDYSLKFLLFPVG